MVATVHNVRIPSPGEFDTAWNAFFRTLAAVIACRAHQYGPRRFGLLAFDAVDGICTASDDDEVQDNIRAMLEDEREAVALGILFEELQHFTLRYRNAYEQLGGVEMPSEVATMEAVDGLGEVFGDPLGGDVIEDAGIITGSIPKLLDKLPGPLKKLMDVLLEILKLARGMVD